MHEVTDEHLDPTAEISLEAVKERTIKGVLALSGRYVVLYGISLFAQGLLGAFLVPEQWGIFAIVSAVVNFLVYFSDVGLAASLIQKKEKVTKEDLITTFTIQQGLVISLLVLLFGFSHKIQGFYGLSTEGLYLLWALGLSFLLSSLKTIPSVLLERKLRFEKIALASIVENITYNFVLVYFAWKGFGIRSFTYAVLARGFLGLIVMYILQPWIPNYGVNKQALKKLLTFGVPYQLNTFIAVLKDDGLAIVLGRVMGLEAMGFLIFAQKWSQFPLRIVLDNVTKVTFPAFSRMQDEKAHLEQAVTRSLFFISFAVFPMVIGFVLVSPVLIQIIPKYAKWQPAMLPLMILGANTMMSAVSTQLTNLLNAIGRIKTTFKLMIMWASLSWLLIPAMASRYGVNGAALAYLLVGLSSVVVFIIVKKHVNYSFWNGAGKTLIASLMMGIAVYVSRIFLPVNIYSVAIMMALGGTVYVASLYILIGDSLKADAKKGFKAVLGK